MNDHDRKDEQPGIADPPNTRFWQWMRERGFRPEKMPPLVLAQYRAVYEELPGQLR